MVSRIVRYLSSFSRSSVSVFLWDVISTKDETLLLVPGIMAILSGIIDPTVEEGDNDHKVSYHITGEIPVESLRPITLNSIEGTTVIVDIWIDPGDFSIDKVKLEGRITETEKSGIIRTLEFSDFNKKVEIESPL